MAGPAPTILSSLQPHLGSSPDSHLQAFAHTLPSLSRFRSRATPPRSLPRLSHLIPMALCTFWLQFFPLGPGNRLPTLRAGTRAGSPPSQTPSTAWARVERRAALGKYLWHQTGAGVPSRPRLQPCGRAPSFLHGWKRKILTERLTLSPSSSLPALGAPGTTHPDGSQDRLCVGGGGGGGGEVRQQAIREGSWPLCPQACMGLWPRRKWTQVGVWEAN